MRVILTTSEVTYVPDNHLQFFQSLFDSEAAPHLAGLILIKGLNLDLIKKALGLCLLGCFHIASTLATNMLSLPLKRRERLFVGRGLPVIRTNMMNAASIIEWVKQQETDLIVNVRTRCIYQKDILQTPRWGCVNIHHGLLPTYRGTMCDLFALSEGRPAGFSMHLMTEKVDAGPILAVGEVSSHEKDYARYLRMTGDVEAKALAKLIVQADREGGLPPGKPNQCEHPIFTKTPFSRPEIKRLRMKGMIL